MESREGSVRKLMRIHLNAQNKQRHFNKKTDSLQPSQYSTQMLKTIYKSPEMKISLRQRKNKDSKTISVNSGSLLPAIKTVNLDSINFQSFKKPLENSAKIKSET